MGGRQFPKAKKGKQALPKKDQPSAPIEAFSVPESSKLAVDMPTPEIPSSSWIVRILSNTQNSLHSWFYLSHPKEKKSEKNAGIWSLLVNCLLAVIFGAVPMPIILRWILWFVCFLGLLYLLSGWQPFVRFPKKTRIVFGCVLAVGFWLAANTTALNQWKSEQASVTEGHLYPKRDRIETLGRIDPRASNVRMTIGPITGPNPLVMILEGAGKNQNPVGSKLSIDRINGVLSVNTDIRDRDGALIVQIQNNEWKVSPSNTWDKNYTRNAVEVLDKRGRVVLKIELFDDYVQVEGEWWHEGGIGIRMLRPYPYDNAKPGPVFVGQLKPGYMPDDPSIVEMFRYPSNKYFGEKASSSVRWWEKVFLLRVLGFGVSSLYPS